MKNNKGFTLIRKFSQGFTLIELLIVISILGIISAVGFSVIPSVRQLARDANRKSDLKQYQVSIENYSNKNNGVYPIYSTATNIPSSGGFCASLAIGSCPLDPVNTSPNQYKYLSDVNGTSYILWTGLEKGSLGYFLVCSNGKSGESATEPTTSSCPL